jgi:uncharacterized protein (DUF2235 family)
MSQFSVITGAIEDMASRLTGIADGAEGWHGQVSTHASAAAQTPADEAVSGLMARWAATLPHFGLAGERLRQAMHGAAEVYAQSDAAVAKASGTGGPAAP